MSRVFNHYVMHEAPWWLRPLLWIDVAKIWYWEKHYWQMVKQIAAVSEEDADIIRKVVPGTVVDVIPNGVGDDFDNAPRKLHYNKTIFYMGNYKWMQNWEAADILAQKVFPLIRNKMPDIKLNIIGQFPTESLKKLSEKNLEVLELQDSDTRGVVKAYQESGLLVAPIYGPSGTRLKILAAMASMTPVVTTPIGSEGLGIKDGISMMVGNTAQELADRVIKILSDKKLYEKIAKNAKKIVDNKFTWEQIAHELELIYEEIIKK